ncbi:MAG: YHS domain-containing (seleno)protein [Hyphomicrobiaceae bacterium]
MPNLSRRRALGAAGFAVSAAMLASFLSLSPALARQPAVFNDLIKGVAVGGYDPVAYHTLQKATPGNPAITAQHEGVTWRFASEANKALFVANPARYAPEYGGYCAWAVASGYTAKGDPEAWTLVGDKLYLNYNKSVQKGWEKDIPGNVKKGDANWPNVLNK